MNRRELWARNIAVLTGVVVLLVAALFARLQNPAPAADDISKDNAGEFVEPILPLANNSVKIAIGKNIFETQGCPHCHAIAGQGNPRLPLDTVGSRRSATAIRQWIIAGDEVKGQISAGIVQVKQSYRRLPADELDALVIYLQSIAAKSRPVTKG